MLTLKSLMTSVPVTTRADASVRDAVELLEDSYVRHLPVVDERGRVVGILSDRDLVPWRLALRQLREGIATAAAANALEQPVEELMRTDVLFLNEDRPIIDALDVILDFRVGAVPIVDDEQRLLGIVSYVDLLTYLRDSLTL